MSLTEPLQPEERATAFESFGRYVLLKKVARGGMAEIILAKQLGLAGFEKLVVVKRILPEYAAQPEFRTMFLDEARLAASLTHPNVVQVYDLGAVDSSLYMAMEFVAGHDLLQIIRAARKVGKQLPLPVVLRIVCDACDGLHYAHTRTDLRGMPLRMVHRDVSPSNILVSYEGVAKLADFGIAKAASRVSKTEAGTVKGKFAYMAPEQITARDIDHRADLFSLGVVLYESLTLVRLFKRDTELAIMKVVLEGVVSPPSSVRPEIPRALDKIVERCLAKRPEDRFGTALEFRLSLQQVLVALGGATQGDVEALMDDHFYSERRAYLRFLESLPSSNPLTDELSFGQLEVTGTGADSATGSSLDNLDVVVLAPPRPARRWAATSVGLALLAALMTAGLFLTVLAPAAPVAVSTGELVLDTNPPHALVYLDGARQRGTTPVELKDLSIGRDYRVRLEAEGLEPAEFVARLDPAAPRRQVSVTMTPSVSARDVRLRTIPPGAVLSVDGKDVGGSPYQFKSHPGMTHQIRAQAPGFEPETTQLTVTRAPETELVLTLEPAVAPAAHCATTLSSTPTLELSVGARRLGRTPITVDLTQGKVTLSWRNAGGGTGRREVEVRCEPTGTAEIVLRKGTLSVTAKPWADVFLGSAKLGTTPVAPRTMYEGDYELKLVNPDLGIIRSVKVTVRPGARALVREDLRAP